MTDNERRNDSDSRSRDEGMHERLAVIDRKIDSLALRLDDFRVFVEARVTRLEARAAAWGSAAGIVVGVVLKLVWK